MIHLLTQPSVSRRELHPKCHSFGPVAKFHQAVGAKHCRSLDDHLRHISGLQSMGKDLSTNDLSKKKGSLSHEIPTVSFGVPVVVA